MDQTGLKSLRASASENTRILIKLQGDQDDQAKRIANLEEELNKSRTLIEELQKLIDQVING